jgi:cytochrome P450
MAADVDPSQRISDLDISNQINTFLFAGSDTTSLGISWCLLFLAQKPEIQARLRTELDSLARQYEHSHDDGYATAEFFALIDKLPLLDNICRETLRFVPPVHSSIRVALKDDVIPISSQMRFEGKDAEAKLAHMKKLFPAGDGIRIAKGEFIHIAIEGFNLSKDVWGEDAHEFKLSSETLYRFCAILGLTSCVHSLFAREALIGGMTYQMQLVLHRACILTS